MLKGLFRIRPDDAERKAQAFADSRLGEILEAMDRDGLVLLEDVVSPNHVEKLGTRMRADMDEVRAQRPIGEESSNESLPPPLNHPWLFRDICFNEFAIQVARAILGDGLYWNSSNSAHPREIRKQNIHHDASPLFPGETEKPLPPHTLVANIPLTDFTEDNGATEVWLGSHRETRRLEVGGDGYEKMLAEHRKRDRILQATAKKGSLIIRDMRLYHGGIPNRTDELRQMIAMVYNRHFYRVLCWMPSPGAPRISSGTRSGRRCAPSSTRKSRARTTSTNGSRRGSPSRPSAGSPLRRDPGLKGVALPNETLSTGVVTFIYISACVTPLTPCELVRHLAHQIKIRYDNFDFLIRSIGYGH